MRTVTKPCVETKQFSVDTTRKEESRVPTSPSLTLMCQIRLTVHLSTARVPFGWCELSDDDDGDINECDSNQRCRVERRILLHDLTCTRTRVRRRCRCALLPRHVRRVLHVHRRSRRDSSCKCSQRRCSKTFTAEIFMNMFFYIWIVNSPIWQYGRPSTFWYKEEK